MSHEPLAHRRMEEARGVARRLRDAGHEALLCGGAVRDRLLGRAPLDVDIATSARPEVGEALFPEAVTVGAKFGVLVIPRPAGPVEVATFRADGCYVDGRRPDDVTFSDAPTDATRRDFTVNGLFEDPETGAIHDHVGGRADLAARLLRAIGDAHDRFEEDHLRILRAARFALQLGFALEPGTQAAVRDMAPRVAEVSAERVRDELGKILRHGRGRALRLLRDLRLLPVVLPEIEAMRGVPQPPRWHPEGDVFVHTALVLDGTRFPPRPAAAEDDVEAEAEARRAEEVLLWAALLHDVAKPTTFRREPDGRIVFHGHDAQGVDAAEQLLERLRLPRRTRERVAALIGQHMRIAATPHMRRATLRRFLAEPDFDLHLRLHAADCGASHGARDVLDFLQAARAELAAEPAVPEPLLTGKDLLALGHRPGPDMGRILAWVQDEQLEGRLVDRDAAVRAVRDRYPVPDQEPPTDA
ncbi:MAG: CCA tRNA nucleotidyltransferase [Planctomycetota bacterium]